MRAGARALFVARLTNLFPLWVLLGAGLALVHPPLFTWFTGAAIVWGLALIMLGMGITLDVSDFRAVLATPGPIAFGFAAQYTIMPLLGWGIARLLALDAPFAVGLILVGCCPGGPSPACSFSYHSNAASTSRSTDGSEINRYSITAASWPSRPGGR